MIDYGEIMMRGILLYSRLMECLHDLANVQQTFSKRPALLQHIAANVQQTSS